MFVVVVLHGELAVPYTRNPPQRGGIPPLGKAQGPISQGVALTAGSHAAQACELRQGLTAATVSDVPRAPWERLARASPDDMPPGRSQREVLGHFFCSMPAQPTALTTKRRPRKSLGQHFLVDPRIANRIVAAADLEIEDTVLEIGPGNGVLTRRLVEHSWHVVAVELDQRLAAELPGRLGMPENLEVHHGDARTVPIEDLAGLGNPYKMIANLPYYAAAPIIRRFLESEQSPNLMVVMVQREVGEAMTAAPGSMTLLSVATQFYAKASVVAQVPARAFRPPPKVASTVVKLSILDTPAVPVEDVARFFALVRAGFAAPRKQLRNSLMQGTGAGAQTVSATLEDAGIDETRRPATLTIAEWGTLDAVWPPDAPRSRAN